MRTRLSFCVLLFACSSSDPPPSNGGVYVIPTKDPDFSIEPTKPVQTERETVEAYVSPILKNGTTKVVVGILEKGETRIYPFGDGANADTMFELGSFTRVFTALLLADAFARQEIPKLSTPVAELLPPGVELPSQDITLRHLATESSGLGFLEFPDAKANPYAGYTAQNLFDALPQLRVWAKPGTEYEQSNLGEGLLGTLLARHAGKSYEALLVERIAGPLDLGRTALTYLDRNVAQGHDAHGVPVNAWDYDALAGAGAVRSSTRDVVKLVAATVSPPDGALGRALQETTDLQAPDLLVSGTSARVSMGLGWQRYADGRVVAAGSGAGCRTFAAMNLARGTAIVMLVDQATWLDFTPYFIDQELGLDLFDSVVEK